MTDLRNLKQELLDAGHSLAWVKQKMILTKIDNDLEFLGKQIDSCTDPEHKEEMEFQHNAIQGIREDVYRTLSLIPD